MVKKKEVKKTGKKAKNKEEVNEEDDKEGKSMDDAFADDEDVEYAPSKPRKVKKKELDKELDEAEVEVEEMSSNVGTVEEKKIILKMSKPISKIKKGDRIRVDGREYTVDQHYVLIDHGTTKEMAIELFDKDDKDFQIRYFNDQVEETIEFYELQEIIFVKKHPIKIEW